jgi:hypothetical protein
VFFVGRLFYFLSSFISLIYFISFFHLMPEKKQGGNKDPLEGEEMMPLNDSKKGLSII